MRHPSQSYFGPGEVVLIRYRIDEIQSADVGVVPVLDIIQLYGRRRTEDKTHPRSLRFPLPLLGIKTTPALHLSLFRGLPRRTPLEADCTHKTPSHNAPTREQLQLHNTINRIIDPLTHTRLDPSIRLASLTNLRDLPSHITRDRESVEQALPMRFIDLP